MANEIDVLVLPFRVVLAYLIVPKSLLPDKWFNQKQSCHARLKCKNEWTTTSMSPTWHVPKVGLFCALSLVLYWDWKVPLKKNRGEVFHLHYLKRYPYPRYSCRTSSNLDLYLPMDKRKLKSVDA